MVDFPIKINEITIMSSEIIPYIRKCESENAIKYIIEKTSCSVSEAKEIVDEIKTSIYNKGFSNTPSKTSDTFKTCPKCNKQYPYLIDHCFECGYSTQTYRNRMKKLQEDIEKPVIEKNIPKCPICGSTAITAGQRGFSIITGFLGSNKTVCRCANCGYSWKPGK